MLATLLHSRSDGRRVEESLLIVAQPSNAGSATDFPCIGGRDGSNAISAIPINFYQIPPRVRSDPHPEGYLGPYWDCIASSSQYIALGQDSLTNEILRSCRRRSPSVPTSIARTGFHLGPIIPRPSIHNMHSLGIPFTY